MTPDEAKTLIGERFPSADVEGETSLVVTIAAEHWLPFGQFTKDVLGCRFFGFLTAVDWIDEGLEVVAQVASLSDGLSVLMKTRLGAGVTACASLTAVYRGADWMERECYDMFGIVFNGHADLRRILLADDWVGFPLLKSYAVDTPYPPYR